jgi:flagellar biosynthesis protein
MDAPREKAIALLYDQSKSAAPKVVASGSGKIAEKIIAAAREAGVHIQKDANLIELLAKVPVGEEIPMALYATVAEVLAFVYRVNEKYKAKLEKQEKIAPRPEKRTDTA